MVFPAGSQTKEKNPCRSMICEGFFIVGETFRFLYEFAIDKYTSNSNPFP